MTIYAPASGIAIIRISGTRTRACLDALCEGTPPPRRATLRTLRDPETGEILDTALILFFPAPASFTGEDTAELHIHGGHACVESVLGALARVEGLHLAEPGEFSRRAFENGKMDLTAAEGLSDLIAAETDAQRRQALRQTEGAPARLFDAWRARLLRLQAACEAALDFPDEEDAPDTMSTEMRTDAAVLLREMRRTLDDAGRGERIREGFRIAIIGAPNVGKSSLVNALARREAAIVHPEAGTTRDVISVRLNLQGFDVLLSDTAGMRAAKDNAVEAEGIRRAQMTAETADMRLHLASVDTGDHATHASARDGDIFALNKTDLPKSPPPKNGVFHLSLKTGAGVAALEEALGAVVATRLRADEPALLTRARHREALAGCADALGAFVAHADMPAELAAETLRHAAHALGRITGRVGVEDMLDTLFSEFCIGK